MADDTIKTYTTVFKADVSDFSKSTKEMKAYISAANSEFKAATASMDRWSDSQEGLNAKIKYLNATLTAQEQILNNSVEEYKKLEKAGKANTDEAQRLRNKINDQQAAVTKTRKEIKHYEGSLKELTDAGVETRQELDKLNKEQEELKNNAKELGGGILKGAAAGLAGIATAAVGALGSLSSLVNETKELRTQMGQLETTFAQQKFSADAAKNTYNELYGVLGDSGKATEAAMHLGQIAKTEEELASYTDILTGVYATFGDSLPVEGLAEAMNHTANLGSVQGNLADALEWAGVNVDDFNAQLGTLNTEEERAQLINSTLNGIYGETSAQYKEVNKDVIAANEAQNAYDQTLAGIAETVQPAMTSFKLTMVGVLETVANALTNVDLEGTINKVSGAITNIVTIALPPLMSVLTWVIDNLNWLAPLLGSVAGLIGGITAAINIYNTVMKIARTVQLLWNAALMANPIGLVIAAIGLLVAAFVVLWNKCEGFRNFFIGMWEKMKSAASTVANAIGGVFTGVFGLIKSYINGIIGGVNSAIKLLNKIKIPDWEIFGKYAGKGINISTIPKLAKGGVVDKATLAEIGEAGKEAVVPLENNTGWIDELASKLNANSATTSKNITVNQTFNKLETSRLAMHKARLETINAIKSLQGV